MKPSEKGKRERVNGTHHRHRWRPTVREGWVRCWDCGRAREMKPKRERAGCPICLVKPCESCGGGDACLSCGLPTKSWPIVLRWKLAATRGGVDVALLKR